MDRMATHAVTLERQGETLPSLVDRAATTLASARSAAEVLEAHDIAGLAYDMAKRAARMAEAKGAHDTLVAAAHRAQGDALLIEARAKHRLADEYDAAQARGELAGPGNIPGRNVSTLAEAGLSAKLIHNARRLRDAEVADPGIVERTINAALKRGDEPTRAEVNRAVVPDYYARKVEQADEARRAAAVEAEFKSLRSAYNKASSPAQRMFREWLEAR